MIRAKYLEVTRLATTGDQVGYGWRPATGKRVVFPLGVRTILFDSENTARKNPSSLT